MKLTITMHYARTDFGVAEPYTRQWTEHAASDARVNEKISFYSDLLDRTPVPVDRITIETER